MSNVAVEMTDAERRIRQRLKDDFPHYAPRCLHIRTKAGSVEPLVLNRAQTYIHGRLEEQLERTGKVRAIVLKGRQQGACLDPTTRVLTSDLRWVPIGEIEPGQELVAVDEYPGVGKGNTRKMRTAVVEEAWRTRQPSWRITFDDGRSVVCSAGHRWLIRKSNTVPDWRSLDGRASKALDDRSAIRVGDEIRTITAPWDAPDMLDAWFGGVIDGEGSLSCGGTGADVTVSQCAGAVLDQVVAHCERRQYGAYVVSDDGPRKTKFGGRAVHAVSVSRMSAMFELIGRSRPVRFIGRHWWDDKRLPASCWRRIVAIEPAGERELVDLQTSTKTFIAEGFVSHNSTYIGGRYYWKVSHRRGVRAFILTHEDEATNNLFGMTQRYHENCPLLVRPHTGAANAKELSFDLLDSGYKVGTAGNRGVGRSQTFQYFHGSEVAFWPHASEHAAGALQAVPNEPGTEVVLESTANGVGGYYHEAWQRAEAGESEFQAIFVPWYWQPEYAMPVPEGFAPTSEEADMQAAYGLTPEQVAWWREKVTQLGSMDLALQEYPLCAVDAFRSTGVDAFIDAALITRARKTKIETPTGPLLLGVDPARFGTDRTAIIRRRGRKAYGLQTHMRLDTMQIAGIVAAIIEAEKPDKVFIDVNGLGAGVYDRLKELGYGHLIIPVNAGEAPLDRERFIIKRDEMWGQMRDWLRDGPVEIPDTDELHADLGTVGFTYDSKSRYKLESKVDMRKRGQRSSDCGDALASTFAYPVASKPAKPFERHRTDWRS